MSLGKIDIINNISTKAQISKKQSSELIEAFLGLIKSKSIQQNIKISNFGTFFYTSSIERVGRNPKTKKSYIIPSRSTLKLSASSKVKAIFN